MHSRWTSSASGKLSIGAALLLSAVSSLVVATGRAQLLKFINSKPPGTRFAVFVVSDDLHLVQGFTSDPQTLFAALDPNHASSRIPKSFLYGENYGAANIGVTLEVLHRIANFVVELPGRKNLIWIAGSFPLKFTSESDTRRRRQRLSLRSSYNP